MTHDRDFYIDGAWVRSSSIDGIDVVNPATEKMITRIASGTRVDVDDAVRAARKAFPLYAATSRQERIDLLQRISDGFIHRKEDLAWAMSREMGVPIQAARNIHFPNGPGHLQQAIKVLQTFEFDRLHGTTMVTKEPIGVCGLITPWNFPINQLVCKIAPALAAGCTMVLKPSEVSPLSALVIAEILHEAGVPAGVFNLVNGSGNSVGGAIASHPDIDMVSFTGSTRAGVAVTKAAADTIKRVTLELGGKSPNILLPDADFARAVMLGVGRCFNNSGQSCISPSRMLVPKDRMRQVATFAREAAQALRVGMPDDEATVLGPVANKAQFEKIQHLIELGIEEGATVVAGGPGRPDGFTRGFFVRPTVFVDVDPRMTIAREEIFGPVLSVIGYKDESDAVRIANDTPYGLAAYIQSADLDRARRVARKLRAGNVQINYPAVDLGAPFGGFKQSGNGREWGQFGVDEYLEIKGIPGYGEQV